MRLRLVYISMIYLLCAKQAKSQIAGESIVQDDEIV